MFRQDICISEAEEGVVTGLPLWKRVLDFVIILILSPALVMLGGIVALLVMCGSCGPIFFRQRRVGHKGREFTCYKFRTMDVGAETESHRGHTSHLIKSETPMTKLDTRRDPRLIPLGAALRATGLDELPQLVNVLRGEMSIVGPRPCISYDMLIPLTPVAFASMAALQNLLGFAAPKFPFHPRK
jgi:lipopolysaccharide/colanic/teichoic acid biosynthesis glycosyltransferase